MIEGKDLASLLDDAMRFGAPLKRNTAYQQLRAALAAQPTAPPVPAGMVLVPVEPTIEMQIAGQEAWMLTHANRPSVEDCKQAIVTYRAMLAATQPVPATGAQPAPAAVPAGWRWVPVEPTREMIAHAERTLPGAFSIGDEYRAMLAAAPQQAPTPHAPGSAG